MEAQEAVQKGYSAEDFLGSAGAWILIIGLCVLAIVAFVFFIILCIAMIFYYGIPELLRTEREEPKFKFLKLS